MLWTRCHPPTPILALMTALVVASGCTTVGPRMMRSDRFDYGQELARSWEEQMLLNLVKLRYRETPTFLEITSVSATYTRSLSGTAGGSVGRGGEASAALEAGVGWEESPTVTYTPLAGEAFARRLMQPLPLETIFLLPQNGWSIERVLRCCVQRLGGVLNAPGAAGPTPSYEPVYQDFHRLAEILRELQIARLLEFEVIEEEQPESKTETQTKTTSTTVTETKIQPAATTKRFVLRILAEPQVVERNWSARQLLQDRAKRAKCLSGRLAALVTGIPESTDTFPATYELVLPGEAGVAPAAPLPETGERPVRLEILPRSLLGVMFFLSQGVAVTEADIHQEETATPTPDQQGAAHRQQQACQKLLQDCGPVPEGMKAECQPPDQGGLAAPRCISDDEATGDFPWREVTGELIQICNRAQPPEKAFARVRHRGRWFYIADSDLASKSTFDLLTQLFALQSGEKAGLAPVPTLNVGG